MTHRLSARNRSVGRPAPRMSLFARRIRSIAVAGLAQPVPLKPGPIVVPFAQ